MVDDASLTLWFKRTWITLTNIADKLDIRCGSAYFIIHEDFGYRKICARWVPKQLTDEHKRGMCGNVHAIVGVIS
jgi:hypothetical protein